MRYLLFLLFVVGCNSGDPSLSPLGKQTGTPEATYAVGLYIDGLGTSPLQLALNGETPLSATQNGITFFSKQLKLNNPFEVSIISQPTDRNCFVSNATGIIVGNNSDINIKCAPKTSYFVGGLISGHDSGEIQLQLGAYETIRLPAGSTTFAFNWYLPNGSYTITISNNSGSNSCKFVSAQSLSRSVTVAGANISDLQISCSPPVTGSYALSGTISGIMGSSLVMKTSDGDTLNVTADGNYSLGSFSGNQRMIVEMVSSPNRYCFFDSSQSHLFSYTPTSTKSDIAITCTTRPTSSCGAATSELPSANNVIRDAECIAGKLMYGGDFTLIGRQYGVLNLDTAVSGTSTVSIYDRIHGQVNKIIADPVKGGWFIGGDFQRVGDKQKRNIVRVDSRLIIDETFDIETDGEVLDLDLDGDQLYITGRFSNIIKDNNLIARSSLARISVSTSTPNIVSLNPAWGNEYISDSSYSASTQIIDSNIYIHAYFTNAGTAGDVCQLGRRAGHCMFVINKNSNTTTGGAAAGSLLDSSSFWKDTLGTVWLLGPTIGLVSTQTLLPHTFNSTVPKSSTAFYHLDGDDLYISESANVKKLNLNSLATTSAASFGNISYAGDAVSNSNLICFFARSNTMAITITSPTATRSSLGCFDKSLGSVKSFTPFSFKQPIKTGLLDSSGKLLIAAQFLTADKSIAVALLDADSLVNLNHVNNLTAGSVAQIASDGTNFIITGNFINYHASCLNCDYLARIISSSGATDASWALSTPLTNNGKALSVSNNELIIAVNGNYLYQISMPTAALPSITQTATSTTMSISTIGSDILTREVNNTISHRELGNLTPVSVGSGTSNIVKASTDFYYASATTLYVANTDGDVADFVTIPTITKPPMLASVNGYGCIYNNVSTINCYSTGFGGPAFSSVWSKLSDVTADMTVFKGVGDYLFYSNSLSAPEKFIPH